MAREQGRRRVLGQQLAREAGRVDDRLGDVLRACGANAEIPLAGRVLVVRVRHVEVPHLHRRDVDEAGLRAERHRMPVVAAERPRRDVDRLIGVARARELDRPAAGQVDVAGPGHGDELLGRDQFAGAAVEHVEEPVLRRLHEDLAHLAADGQLGEHDRLRGGVVPGVAGRRLVMPDVLAGVGPERHDGRQEEVVAAAGAPQVAVPGRAVADADVEQVEFRVVDDRVPDRAAAASRPPLAGPGLGGHPHRLVLESVRRVARHGVEAPRPLAGLRVVGVDVAADAVLGAAVADDDLALRDPRRAGDRVHRVLGHGHRGPDLFARLGVDGDQAAVERGGDHLAAVERRSAVHGVAAGLHRDGAGHLRVVRPQRLAGDGVHRVDHVPGAGRVHHAVDDQRRGLETALGVRFLDPGDAELIDVAVVDPVERAVALLLVRAAVGQPVAGAAGGADQGGVVDGVGRFGPAGRWLGHGRGREHQRRSRGQEGGRGDGAGHLHGFVSSRGRARATSSGDEPPPPMPNRPPPVATARYCRPSCS